MGSRSSSWRQHKWNVGLENWNELFFVKYWFNLKYIIFGTLCNSVRIVLVGKMSQESFFLFLIRFSLNLIFIFF